MSMVFGILPSQHAAIRPVMEDMFTLGSPDRRAEVQAIVEEEISGFLDHRKEHGLRVPDDVTALVHQILNRVVLGRNVSFSYAQHFARVQSEVVALGAISQLLPSMLHNFIAPVRGRVAAYMKEYRTLIEERWGEQLAREDCSPSDNCLAQAASMVWDAFYAAGGLSVPTTISTGLGLLFSQDGSNPFPNASFSADQALSFYWENIRVFPPAVGFPHWEKRPTCEGSTDAETAALSGANGSTGACPLGESDPIGARFPRVNQYGGGRRVVSILGLAQADPRKWGTDAGRFVVRPLEEYEKKSLGFAELAVDGGIARGRMNRDCPGKDLALMIGAKFFELFNRGDWAEPHAAIRFQAGPTWVSGFTLSSKTMVGQCREVCPRCGGADASCYYTRGACEAARSHCSLCKDCGSRPPTRWGLIRHAACQTC